MIYKVPKSERTESGRNCNFPNLWMEPKKVKENICYSVPK